MLRASVSRGLLVVFATLSILRCAGQQSRVPLNATPQNEVPSLPSIHGVVVSTVDGRPIPGVLVRLSTGPRLLRDPMLTDEFGRFEVSGVPPGTVYISAQKSGFLRTMTQDGLISNYREVQIKDQDVQVELALMPGAVITGRIQNQVGEPVIKIPVGLLRRSIQGGLYVWQFVQGAVTDSAGAYRISSIEPGVYLLRTGMTPVPDIARPYDPTMNMNARLGFAPTYYPNATDQTHAKPIAVVAGQEVTANWILKKEPFQRVTIPYSGDLADGAGSGGSSVTGDDGQFVPLYPYWDHDHFRFILFAPQGSYALHATLWPRNDWAKNGAASPWKDGSTQEYRGLVEFTVQDGPRTLLEMPLQHPVSIPIDIMTSFTQVAAASPTLRIQRDICFSLSGQQGETNVSNVCWRLMAPNEKHSFKDVVPGRYWVSAGTGYGMGMYVRTLTCGNFDLFREPLLVGGGQPPCSIEAVLRDDVASIELEMTPKGLAAMSAAGATMASSRLISLDNPPQPSPFADIFFRASGTAHFREVVPGTYLAIISNEGRPMPTPVHVPMVGDPPIAYRDPKVIEKLRTCGKVITLHPGEHAHILLDWCAN